MKHKSTILRRRLAYVESQLEVESMSSRHSPRLKEERRRRLTEEKAAIQKSLDSIVYPILTIPFEITAEIFVHCLPSTPAPASLTIAPMLLARICRLWRNIAWSTPKLWAALRITKWDVPNPALLTRLWFSRAGGAPKLLSLDLPFRRCRDSFFATTDGCRCCPSSSLFTDHWAHLSSFHGTYFTLADCLALLSLAPRLAHCEFDELPNDLLPPIPASRVVPAILLPCYFSSTPSLAPLSLHIDSGFQQFNHALLLAFFERAPDIRALTLYFYEGSAATLTIILNAIRDGLTSLRVAASITAVFELLRLLSDSPTFLPNIDDIDLAPFGVIVWTDSMVKTLVDAVTSRWEAKSTAQLLNLEFSNASLPLHPQIVACVSELKGKGMRIHVGRESRSIF
ncbi:hypothetical protein C8R46DRAFT_1223729 [Mycena filopes]|nr:hypothetical protein C8R46DRAFT_1223729 [Mycena filopes]